MNTEQAYFSVRRIAVLGAGVMGAQIAAHCVNAAIPVLLFDVESPHLDPYFQTKQAIERLTNLDPAPLALASLAHYITPLNYNEHDLAQLRGCDLVIEAVAERLDIKQSVLQQIAPYLAPHAVLASNTSGLPIHLLAKMLPAECQPRFCGMHFFNPPRYLSLVELIRAPQMSDELSNALESFLTSHLGKNVIRAHDTPNFIANRLGLLSVLSVLYHAEHFEIPLDIVDKLTGVTIGRPKSATCRTLDVVGLDTFAYVVKGTSMLLKSDPWNALFIVPKWLQQLISQGAFGQKSKKGIYRKQGDKIEVFDLKNQSYRHATLEPDAEIQAILKLPSLKARFTALRASVHPQARFLWAIHRDVFHYAAFQLAEIADNVRDMDLAMRWGFGWQLGIFELWQAIGWQTVTDWLNADLANGEMLCSAPLPPWVSQITGVYQTAGAWSATRQYYENRELLPVYRKQYYPEGLETPLIQLPEFASTVQHSPLLNKLQGKLLAMGFPAAPKVAEIVLETPDLCAWHQGDGVLIVTFLSKMHCLRLELIESLYNIIELAERQFCALVLWQTEAPFSVGANLEQIVPAIAAGEFDLLEHAVEQFQAVSQRLRYSYIPTVAAIHGLALGGGCEWLMHCDRVVANIESYIGLVEVGIGLIPAGGGCKLLAQRAAQQMPEDPFKHLKNLYQTVALGKVSRSALEAKQLGFLRERDVIIMNPSELLYVACQQARSLAETNYYPPFSEPIKAVGRGGIANLKTQLLNMQEGGFISEHDYLIGSLLAEVICGGDIESHTEVSEQWYLNLEKRAFMQLLKNEKSQARAQYLLTTGKVLRN